MESHMQERLGEMLPKEIVDLTTGDTVSLTDADGMIGAFARTKKACDAFYAQKLVLQNAIARLTTGDSKTRRLRGELCQVKVEIPDDGWEQSILKEAWNSFPDLRDEFLKIDSIGVRLREWKKLQATAGPPDLEQLKRMIASANRGPSGNPKVTVETVEG